MADQIKLTAVVLLICGLALGWLSSPLGPPLALLGAVGLAVHLGRSIGLAVRPRPTAHRRGWRGR